MYPGKFGVDIAMDGGIDKISLALIGNLAFQRSLTQLAIHQPDFTAFRTNDGYDQLTTHHASLSPLMLTIRNCLRSSESLPSLLLVIGLTSYLSSKLRPDENCLLNSLSIPLFSRFSTRQYQVSSEMRGNRCKRL